jgi:predicted membrane metal-binding protein
VVLRAHRLFGSQAGKQILEEGELHTFTASGNQVNLISASIFFSYSFPLRKKKKKKKKKGYRD